MKKGGRTVETAAPALFAFMGPASSFVGLSASRWASAPLHYGSGCFRIGQRKPIIRTHLLSEKGSDYRGLVRLKGLEPTRVSAREPKSRMSTNSITGAYGRRDVPAAVFVQLTTPGWQNSRPESPPGASAPPIRPPAAAAPASAACRCSYSPWKIRGPRCRE